jgi:hypothetical protein
MNIEQYQLFGKKNEEILSVKKPVTPKKKSAAYSLNINLELGNDQPSLKGEGILILRMLLNRHAKACYASSTNVTSKKGLLYNLAREIKIKKGFAPQNVTVMDALIQNHFSR